MDDLELKKERADMVDEFPSDRNESPSSQRLVIQRDSHLAKMNKALLVYKAFYFLFYSSLGSTIPFLSGYFQQIGLASSHLWALSTVRPFSQMCVSPLWGILADRYLSKKMILQFSLFIWFILAISLAFVEPTNQLCQFVSVNHTDSKVLNSTELKTGFFRRRSLDTSSQTMAQRTQPNQEIEEAARLSPEKTNFELTGAFGSASGSLPGAEDEESGYGSPTNASELNVTRSSHRIHSATLPSKVTASHQLRVNFTTRNELKNSPSRLYGIFLTTLLLLSLSELFLCPVFLMVDAALLSRQTEECFSYGHQRVFGSVGYAAIFFIVWLLLNNSLRPVCGAMYADYVICFCCFCVVMLLTLVLTVKFDFPHNKPEVEPYIRLKRIFHNRHHGSLAVAICFVGFSHSVISNFANKFLLESNEKNGVVGVLKFFYFLGEPLGFILSSLIINRTGSINVIFVVLTSYTINLFACSFVSSPWHLLPLGFLEAFTYALSWVVCATYVINSAPRDCAATVQGVLQSVYLGCGGSCGLLVGGGLINMAGQAVSFRLFTIIAIIVSIIFTMGLGHVNFRDRNYYTLLIGTLGKYTGETTITDAHNTSFPNLEWDDHERRNTADAQTLQNMPFPLSSYLDTDKAERSPWDIHPEGSRSPQGQENELLETLSACDDFDGDEDNANIFM